MAATLLILAILTYCPGVISGATLTQPLSQSVSLGQAAKVSCTVSGSISDFHWIRQRPGQGPQFVLYSTSTRGEGIPDRFTGSSSGSNQYLNIANSKVEDEADYYCAAWDDRGSQWIFGGGTQLTVSGGPPSPPTVNLYCPSKEEMASKQTATLVCSITGFYPSAMLTTWEADGTPISNGVQTTKPIKDNDKYMASSYLILPAPKWQSNKDYSCKVRHEGQDYMKSVSQSQCP